MTDPQQRRAVSPKASHSSLGAGFGRAARGGVLGLVVICAVLALSPVQSLAATVHTFTTGFGGLGSNTLSNPTDVAVDNSAGPSAHDVYVTDPGHFRVEKFDPSGNFILMFGKAVDKTTGGDICTAASGDTCQPGFPGSASLSGSFLAPTFVAVDGSAGPSAGDVYVGDAGTNVVQKFTSSGSLITTWGTSGQLGFCGMGGIAVDPAGNLFSFGCGAVLEFGQDGSSLTSYGVPRGSQSVGLAVDSLDSVFKVNGEPSVEKFNSSTDFGQVTASTSANGLGLDSATGDLYVADGGTSISQYAFDSSGSVIQPSGPACAVVPNAGCPPTASFSSPALSGAEGIAIDGTSNTVYVANTGGGDVLAAVPLPLGVAQVTTGLASNVGHTTATLTGHVDPAGGGNITDCQFVYGLSPGSGQIVPCSPATPYSDPTDVTANVTGLQPDKTYHYAVVASTAGGVNVGEDETFTPQAVLSLKTDPPVLNTTSAHLNGSFTGDGNDTKYFFEYGIDEGYGQKTATEDAGSPSGHTTVAPILISGLQSHHIYHYRIVATNSIGTTVGQDVTFITPSAPIIEGAYSSDVTANSAVLHAKINPEGFDTSYHFEYGTTPGLGTNRPVEEEDIGSGEVAEELTVELTGLQSTNTYYFRVTATNEWGTASSESQTFSFYPPDCPNAHVRQQTGAELLPDCRAYELVSSPDAGAASVTEAGWENESPYVDDVYAYGAFAGIIPGAGDPPNTGTDRYVATRTANGWVSKFVGVPANETGDNGSTAGSIDGTRYVSVKTGGFFGGPGAVNLHAPILRDSQDHLLGQLPTNLNAVPNGDEGLDSAHSQWKLSPDFHHFIFSSNSVAYLNGGLTRAPGSAYDNNVDTSSVDLVSKTPAGDDIPEEANSGWGGDYIQILPSSSNGSHILLGVPDGERTCSFGSCVESRLVHLYMRVNDSVTYDVSAGHGVTYAGMTSDGSKVFFTSKERVTAEDQDNSVDLYMWSASTDKVTAISTGNNGAGNTDACKPADGYYSNPSYYAVPDYTGANHYTTPWDTACDVVLVNGARGFPPGGNGYPPEPGLQGSDNFIASGSGDIYFYSPEQLDGSKGIPNQQNLYVYRNGQVQFVATFAPGNYCEREAGREAELEEGRPTACSNGPVGRINVSPGDDHMAFVSARQLTGYDNHGLGEMYTYDPSGGAIKCVSCDPNGEPPVTSVSASTQGRFMADDGRTFFLSPDPLVPADQDHVRDVYEYVEGRPQLITSGTTAVDHKFINIGGFGRSFIVGLIGVSADGTNVFFSTFDTLVGQDQNGNFYKIYDARSNGGFPFVPISAPCQAADECHGAGTSAPPPAPQSSAANLGSGGNATVPSHRRHHPTRRRRHRKSKHKRTSIAGQVRGFQGVPK
jgi:hypothetical protein